MSKKRDLELFIVDVFLATFKVKRYTKEFINVDDLLHSEIHWDATIRQLEIIGEALNNLLKDELFNSISPKYFRKIVNFRNSISHGYFGIDQDEVWDIITSKLDALVLDMKKSIKTNLNLNEAIETSIEENLQNQDTQILDYIIKLKKELQ